MDLKWWTFRKTDQLSVQVRTSLDLRKLIMCWHDFGKPACRHRRYLGAWTGWWCLPGGRCSSTLWMGNRTTPVWMGALKKGEGERQQSNGKHGKPKKHHVSFVVQEALGWRALWEKVSTKVLQSKMVKPQLFDHSFYLYRNHKNINLVCCSNT